MTSPFSHQFGSTLTRAKTDVRYYMGIDLGQAADPSAIAVLRRVRKLETYTDRRDAIWKDVAPILLQLGYLERIPLGVSYPSIVRHVIELLQRPIWKGNIQVVIDETGVGRPVCDLFRSAGVTFLGVNITAGNEERIERDRAYVPKITIISLMQALLHEARLHLHSELAEAENLRRELENFNVRYTDAGRMTFAAGGSNKDDMTLALALAAWRSSIKEVEPARMYTWHMGR
jgi:hypothetical protein